MCAFLGEEAEAKFIKYPDLPAEPGCRPNFPKGCIKVPANPYRRGCSPETRCREG
ncbi:hypothetical protein Tsubulata_031644 [Turnera subulata]|uniref:Uncharacterized protein n=1 Tax=Turnera subulata TaxID=218843 RepID=A0A9Q0FFV5_9ROSI|nr:hypothetical protein Tsubulata_031644 [Turnera subulata]